MPALVGISADCPKSLLCTKLQQQPLRVGFARRRHAFALLVSYTASSVSFRFEDRCRRRRDPFGALFAIPARPQRGQCSQRQSPRPHSSLGQPRDAN